jgi:hypothetical protein
MRVGDSKCFRDKASYTHTTMGVTSPEDIIDMTALNLTGGGKANFA